MELAMPLCLCATLLLSLALPLRLSGGATRPAAPVMARVWAGQLGMGAIAQLMVGHLCPPVLALTLSAMVCLACARALRCRPRERGDAETV